MLLASRAILLIAVILQLRGASAWAGSPSPNCTDLFQETKRNGKVRYPASCSQLLSAKTLLYRRFENGTVLPNPSALTRFRDLAERAEYEKALTPSPAQKEQVQKTIERIRGLFIDRVRGDTPRDALTSLQKELLQRLENLKVSLTGASTVDCPDLTPTATYDPKKHQLNVCPSAVNLPIEALIPLLAHEFGHVTDACFFDHREVDPGKLAKVVEGDDKALSKCSLPRKFLDEYRHLYKDLLNDNPGSIPPISPLYLIASHCDLFMPRAFPLTVKDLDAHPFARSRKCASRLDKSPALEARWLELNQEILKHSAVSPREFGGRIPIPQDLITKNLGCSFESNERHADQVGAEMTAEYLTRYGSTLSKEALPDMLWFWAVRNCTESNPDYDPASDRIAAFLQYPEIQRAVGCSGLTKPALCPISTGASSGTRTSKSVR